MYKVSINGVQKLRTAVLVGGQMTGINAVSAHFVSLVSLPFLKSFQKSFSALC